MQSLKISKDEWYEGFDSRLMRTIFLDAFLVAVIKGHILIYLSST